VVGILRLDFRVPGSRSLKEKRSVVRSFLERARNRYPVSIAETGYQEDHSLASVTAAVVSARPDGADEVIDSLVNLLEENYDVVILHADGEISEGE
jgi:uncharacterized protein YlxP (DUF503 family)